MRKATMIALSLACAAACPADARMLRPERVPFVKDMDIVIITDWRTNAKETRTCKVPSYMGFECLVFSGGPIAITAKDGQKFTCASNIANMVTNGEFGCYLASPALLRVASGNEVRCPEKVELSHSGMVDMCQESSKKVYSDESRPIGGQPRDR